MSQPKVWTTYYSAIARMDKSREQRDVNWRLVPISQEIPDWLPRYHPRAVRQRYMPLAPPAQLLGLHQQGISWERYTQLYHQMVLARLNPKTVYEDLRRLIAPENTSRARGQAPILLCYEADHSECHRGLVAQWLSSAGIMCQEWDDPMRQEKTTSRQARGLACLPANQGSLF